MINELKIDAEQRMSKSIDALGNAFNKIRTGRAHSSLLNGISVDYYGVDTPLSQAASIVVEDSRTLSVTPCGPVTCDRERLRPKLGVLAAERPSR